MSAPVRYSSGSPYEDIAGFSRAVRVGNRVIFTLTGPVMPGGAPAPEGAYAQATRCLEILTATLREAGGKLGDVIRTEMHHVPGVDPDELYRFHRDAFGAVRPVTKILPVTALTDPSWLVELEIEAVLS